MHVTGWPFRSKQFKFSDNTSPSLYFEVWKHSNKTINRAQGITEAKHEGGKMVPWTINVYIPSTFSQPNRREAVRYRLTLLILIDRDSHWLWKHTYKRRRWKGCMRAWRKMCLCPVFFTNNTVSMLPHVGVVSEFVGVSVLNLASQRFERSKLQLQRSASTFKRPRQHGTVFHSRSSYSLIPCSLDSLWMIECFSGLDYSGYSLWLSPNASTSWFGPFFLTSIRGDLRSATRWVMIYSGFCTKESFSQHSWALRSLAKRNGELGFKMSDEKAGCQGKHENTQISDMPKWRT